MGFAGACMTNRDVVEDQQRVMFEYICIDLTKVTLMTFCFCFFGYNIFWTFYCFIFLKGRKRISKNIIGTCWILFFLVSIAFVRVLAFCKSVLFTTLNYKTYKTPHTRAHTGHSEARCLNFFVIDSIFFQFIIPVLIQPTESPPAIPSLNLLMTYCYTLLFCPSTQVNQKSVISSIQ